MSGDGFHTEVAARTCVPLERQRLGRQSSWLPAEYVAMVAGHCMAQRLVECNAALSTTISGDISLSH